MRLLLWEEDHSKENTSEKTCFSLELVRVCIGMFRPVEYVCIIFIFRLEGAEKLPV